jgi:hypothetical protein
LTYRIKDKQSAYFSIEVNKEKQDKNKIFKTLPSYGGSDPEVIRLSRRILKKPMK